VNNANAANSASRPDWLDSIAKHTAPIAAAAFAICAVVP
jgi:hypothetical protein